MFYSFVFAFNDNNNIRHTLQLDYIYSHNTRWFSYCQLLSRDDDLCSASNWFVSPPVMSLVSTQKFRLTITTKLQFPVFIETRRGHPCDKRNVYVRVTRVILLRIFLGFYLEQLDLVQFSLVRSL